MFCDEALDAIEPIAAGELTPEGRIAHHLATCPNCAAALDDANRVERLLRLRPRPAPPPQFTAHTLSRIRRARWRSDQALDLGFNLAIASIVFGLVAAVWAVLHFSGLTAVSNDVVELFGSGLMTFTRRVAPAVPLYAGATALLATALAIWWWAERDTV